MHHLLSTSHFCYTFCWHILLKHMIKGYETSAGHCKYKHDHVSLRDRLTCMTGAWWGQFGAGNARQSSHTLHALLQVLLLQFLQLCKELILTSIKQERAKRSTTWVKKKQKNKKQERPVWRWRWRKLKNLIKLLAEWPGNCLADFPSHILLLSDVLHQIINLVDVPEKNKIHPMQVQILIWCTIFIIWMQVLHPPKTHILQIVCTQFLTCSGGPASWPWQQSPCSWGPLCWCVSSPGPPSEIQWWTGCHQSGSVAAPSASSSSEPVEQLFRRKQTM